MPDLEREVLVSGRAIESISHRTKEKAHDFSRGWMSNRRGLGLWVTSATRGS
jgi:hypothetical protein